MRGGLYGRDKSAGRIVPHRARDSCEGLHLGQDIRQQRRGRFTADGAVSRWWDVESMRETLAQHAFTDEEQSSLTVQTLLTVF